ncbi:MAG: hypothetical protein P8X51_19395, partial [Maritimibacter sp.]
LSCRKVDGDTNDQYLRSMSFNTNAFYWDYKKLFVDKHIDCETKSNKLSFTNAVAHIEQIADIKESLADDQKVRIGSMRLAALRDNILRLLDLEIWAPERSTNYVEPEL